MAIGILLVCFISLFCSLSILKISGNRKKVLLATVLIFSALLVFCTELASVLVCLNRNFILCFWCIVSVANLLYIILNSGKLKLIIKETQSAVFKSLTALTIFEKVALALSAAILLLVFVQALLYPPNNWDSMTYHMARITSWISHQSVAHYPTHIIRQLYQPPFAEYVVMHVGLLNQGDFFANTVQFFFFLFTLIPILLIIEEFGLGRKYKIIGVVTCVTIPEGLLQASSTQNDIVVSFFVISAFYLCIRVIKGGRFMDYLFLGLCIGLGALTKGTAYLYFAPILFVFAVNVIILFFKTFNYNYIWFSLITILVFAAVNSGHYDRNYKLTGNVLGIDQQESKFYSNQTMSPVLLCSNLVKNAGLHINFMYLNGVANFSNSFIYQLHSWAGLDINRPGINYRDIKYTTQNASTSEDSAPNMIHFVLIAICAVVLLWHLINHNQRFVTGLLLIVSLQILLFCLYLKWQPWHSRLHLTFFLMWIPLLCYTFSIKKFTLKLFYCLTPFLFAYAVLIVLHNTNRPYTNKIAQSRYQKYFINRPAAYDEYAAVRAKIEQANYTNIGLMLGIDDWEYPLFDDCFSKNRSPVYLQIDNLSKTLPQSQVMPDCIVSTNTNKPFIIFKGRRFDNQDTQNTIIHLYK